MPQTNQQNLGRFGENLAANHLVAKGYTIVQRNWHCKAGEIDIVAQLGDELVFAEVRTRRSHSTEAAFASVDMKKQERLQKAAFAYIEAHAPDALWRIDVVAVAVPNRGKPIVEHVQDALGW